MALSEDSRSLLQLLLGRGKSYEDISDLLGVDETEVRDRAHKALTEINGQDPDQDANLTDYLLGQCDPIGRADVARELSTNVDAAETASSLSDQLRLLVPGAELPSGRSGKASAPRKPGKKPPERPSRKKNDDGEDKPSASSWVTNQSQKRLIAVLLLVALLVLVVVLIVTGAFSSDDSNQPATPSASNAGAVMQPVADQGGSGRVQFGRVEDNFAANLQFSELKPSGKTGSYILWMDGSIGAFPLNEFQVDESGSFGNTIVLPPEALCSITAGIFTELSVSRVSRQEAAAIVNQTSQALKGNQRQLPAIAGDAVFEGPVALPQSLRQAINDQCQSTDTGASGGTGSG